MGYLAGVNTFATHRSVANIELSKQEAQTPQWPNQKKLHILEKRWLLAFQVMANKLEYPGNQKNADAGWQEVLTKAFR